jgi:hypothetical protein
MATKNRNKSVGDVLDPKPWDATDYPWFCRRCSGKWPDLTGTCGYCRGADAAAAAARSARVNTGDRRGYSRTGTDHGG